ncbi:MAG: 50S ribosome-binding GTPase [Planctomycetaceae bacterium]|nr:50S ribosome-binding GTPase [Planctomycetaceae bacterium]
MTEPPARITLLTPHGRGAVATLQFEGPCETLSNFFQAANGQPIHKHPLNRVVFGHWGREVPEDVVICRTAETLVEIHCHGGDVASSRIQQDLESYGCQRELWPDLLERTEGVYHREWTESLVKTTTQRTAAILLSQKKLLTQFLQELQSEECPRIAERIQALLRWADFGQHLTKPWDVVLGGPPNVGKSSLINALVGYSRSIVYDQPGTTRDVVTAETAFEGWPIRFADTAGLRQGAAPLEAEGFRRAQDRLASADCQILLTDVSGPPTDIGRKLREEFPQAIFVAHKSDLPQFERHDLPSEALPVSSVTGAGVEELAQAIVNRLIPQVPPSDQPIAFTYRQIQILIEAHQAAEADDKVKVQMLLGEILS